eukprot:UN2418
MNEVQGLRSDSRHFDKSRSSCACRHASPPWHRKAWHAYLGASKQSRSEIATARHLRVKSPGALRLKSKSAVRHTEISYCT